MVAFTIFDNELYALNPVFCKGRQLLVTCQEEALLRDFHLGHLELLHTAVLDFINLLYKVELMQTEKHSEPETSCTHNKPI